MTEMINKSNVLCISIGTEISFITRSGNVVANEKRIAVYSDNGLSKIAMEINVEGAVKHRLENSFLFKYDDNFTVLVESIN